MKELKRCARDSDEPLKFKDDDIAEQIFKFLIDYRNRFIQSLSTELKEEDRPSFPALQFFMLPLEDFELIVDDL